MLLCLERFTEEDMTKRGQQIGLCVREGNLIKGTWRKPDSRHSKLLRAFVIITCGLNLCVFVQCSEAQRVPPE